MGRAPCCDKASVKKGPWSPEEDAKLKAYIEQHGTGNNWIALPQKIGLRRCGKSCRLRWLNYLRPNIKHGSFSEEEDSIICSLYISIGSRWSIIAAQLPGRTDNDIKNYWNTRLKKKLLGRRKDHSHARRHHQQLPISTPTMILNNNINPQDQSTTTTSNKESPLPILLSQIPDPDDLLLMKDPNYNVNMNVNNITDDYPSLMTPNSSLLMAAAAAQQMGLSGSLQSLSSSALERMQLHFQLQYLQNRPYSLFSINPMISRFLSSQTDHDQPNPAHDQITQIQTHPAGDHEINEKAGCRYHESFGGHEEASDGSHENSFNIRFSSSITESTSSTACANMIINGGSSDQDTLIGAAPDYKQLSAGAAVGCCIRPPTDQMINEEEDIYRTICMQQDGTLQIEGLEYCCFFKEMELGPDNINININIGSINHESSSLIWWNNVDDDDESDHQNKQLQAPS